MVNSNRILNKVLLFFMLGTFASSLFATTAGFDVLVVDAETFDPIKGVDVVGWFSNGNGWKAWTESAPTYVDKKITDKHGRCHVTGETNIGETGVNIRCPPKGYYPNCFRVRHIFTEKPIFPFTHWRPTDLVITAALYKIQSPVPLFVKKAFGKFDVDWPMDSDAGTNAVLRYDFIVGDWLPPAGKGIVADMTVRATMAASRHIDRWSRLDGSEYLRTTRFYDVTDTFEFCGEGNGVVRKVAASNAIPFVRKAGVDGFGKTFHMSFGKRKKIIGPNVYYDDYTDSNKDVVYVFRIRSRFDEHGNLKEAYYGKIYGDFRLYGKWMYGHNGISFIYYLNPKPNDRNLEWDMKNNLCPKTGDVRVKVNHSLMLLP